LDDDRQAQPRRVLLVHNRYRQPGGEDATYESERDLLTNMGHPVETLEFDNRDLKDLSAVRAAAEAVWCRSSKAKVSNAVRSFSPDIVHFHNTFARVSPAAFWVCKALRVPVVQTVQNYRLMCANALLLRQGLPCEDCLTATIPWPGVVHRCYHDSSLQSAAVAAIGTAHRLIGTYTRKVDAFIAVTEFARRKLIQGGLPETKLHVKPNFVTDTGLGEHRGGFCLFAGRLSSEKGLTPLLDAWRLLGGRIRLLVAGSGPLESLMRTPPAGVEYLGAKSRAEVLSLMRAASLVVVPSVCYENFPVTIAEAFSVGLPVAASRLGAMEEILRGEAAGWLFRPNDPEDIARTVTAAWNGVWERARKGQQARAAFEQKYSPARNYEMLMGIYSRAASVSAQSRSDPVKTNGQPDLRTEDGTK
jgi:glycosyltransferase involved in cell wall biosynthesis